MESATGALMGGKQTWEFAPVSGLVAGMEGSDWGAAISNPSPRQQKGDAEKQSRGDDY